ncbi:monocyte to macrophage differentiation factor 2 isoform X5 [Rhinolophus ferrumequinum]|uniref:monocyte to macrophage differentiation factor 2 isoform X5 n=1 Tax=Rhinolophus ferrumequinum TaxID=59479 RepID=UPI00140FF1AD|nr:monocyte to macrophage differentiation factor 2 isoform X5 [Rhinolophus ferrumequinum]
MAGMQTVPVLFQLRASRLLALKPTGGGDTGEKEEGGYRRPPHPDQGESWRGPPRTGRALGPRGPRRLARSPQPRPATICSGFTSAAPGARAPAPVRAPRPPPTCCVGAGCWSPRSPRRRPSSRCLNARWTPMEPPQCSPPGYSISRRPSTRGLDSLTGSFATQHSREPLPPDRTGMFMNHRVPSHKRYQPTEYEHAANCATHALWIIPSILGSSNLYFLSDDDWETISAWIYGLGLCGLFVVSTVFHTISWKKSHLRMVEHCLHMFDRMVIYFFIAASYAPWLNLRELGPWASHMRWLVWIMASVGTVYVFFFHERVSSAQNEELS